MDGPWVLSEGRFAKPGEYAEAGTGLFWRESEPDLVLHPFVLTGAGCEPLPPVRAQGSVPVPWGSLVVDVRLLGDRLPRGLDSGASPASRATRLPVSGPPVQPDLAVLPSVAE